MRVVIRLVRSPKLWILIAGIAMPLALWSLLPMQSKGQQSAAEIQTKIQKTQAQLSQKRSRSQRLVSNIGRYSRKINAMESGIDRLRNKQLTYQQDLDQKRSTLVKIQRDLRNERARVIRLQARLAESRKVLSKRLLELYKADEPDLISVVINSDGFADLLERREFLSQIGEQDKRIVDNVRSARKDADSNAKKLDQLDAKQQRITTEVLKRRNQVANVKQGLLKQQGSLRAARTQRKAVLGDVRGAIKRDQKRLDDLEKASQRIQGQLQSPGFDPGPIKQGSGQMVWPVNGPITSPFCERRSWESCHPGIDIGVPSGTPIRAADSGTVVLQQGTGASGGYGNFTCIQHGKSLSTCYAHQSSFAVGSGANVKKGQVIGSVGCTGRCFGDHLHFEVRINGAVTNPMGYL